jgi:hypothetical protein
MASKKQMEKRIADLEAQVRRLENMHATILPRNSWEMPSFMRGGSDWEDPFQRRGYYNGRQLTRAEITLQPYHPQPKQVDYSRITNIPKKTVNTDRIPKVSLEELARFVLDGTPIERKTKEEVIYQTSYSPNETSESVETKLGSISVIERTD